jgi:hypothetical protein
VEPLLTAQVPVGRLNRNVTQKELDLLQLAPGGMAQARAGPATIVGAFGPPSCPNFAEKHFFGARCCRSPENVDSWTAVAVLSWSASFSLPAGGGACVICLASCVEHNVEMGSANRRVESALRLRICASPACRASFTICVSCDRGQRYCSPSCRETVRRRQRCAADRRYQQSERGRLRHQQRQRRYRERQIPTRVTDQGCRIVTFSQPRRWAALDHCAICGRLSPWINPFPTIPQRK